VSAPATTLRTAAETARAAPRRYKSRTLRTRLTAAILHQPVILACVWFIALITLLAIVAPLLPLNDPTSQSVLARLQPPSAQYPMGTDRLGRDVLSRLVWGTQVSLVVGVGVVALSAVVGTLAGLVSGYFDGWYSDLIMRLTDILLAFPGLVLAIVLVGVLGNHVYTVILAISVGAIPRFIRIARGSILSVRHSGYVEAARALGAGSGWIMGRHVLLNAIDPLLVICTFLIPLAILLEATLSFLGLGVVEPTPTWGNMIYAGQIVLREAPWLVFFPSIAIVLTVLAFNLVGDAVRDALDPNVSGL
jgi:peptide/nickel transport system permease protein